MNLYELKFWIFINFQHEKTDKIIKNHDLNAKNHDFERKIFWVAHFFVILRCQGRSPKNDVYKKRSNPKSKRSIRIVIIQRVKLAWPVKIILYFSILAKSIYFWRARVVFQELPFFAGRNSKQGIWKSDRLNGGFRRSLLALCTL